MMMKKSLVLMTGILVGLMFIMGTTSVFSMIGMPAFGASQQDYQSGDQNQADQQVMQKDGSMAMTQNDDQSAMHSSDMKGSMMGGISVFSGEGMSMTDGVKVTGVAISGNNEVSANLRYFGSGDTPAVTVVAMTQSMDMMSMMGSGDNGMMMSSGINTQKNMMNNSSDSMSMSMRTHSGSNVLNAGWKSDSAITIKLQGNTTAYDDAHVMIMVFPFLK